MLEFIKWISTQTSRVDPLGEFSRFLIADYERCSAAITSNSSLDMHLRRYHEVPPVILCGWSDGLFEFEGGSASAREWYDSFKPPSTVGKRLDAADLPWGLPAWFEVEAGPCVYRLKVTDGGALYYLVADREKNFSGRYSLAGEITSGRLSLLPTCPLDVVDSVKGVIRGTLKAHELRRYGRHSQRLWRKRTPVDTRRGVSV